MHSGTTPANLLSFLNNLSGIRRVPHGRDPELDGGLDCAGLVLYLYRQFGHPIDDIDLPYSEVDVPTEASKFLLIERLLLRFDEITELHQAHGRLINGDVVTLSFPRNPVHLGIHTGGSILSMGEKQLRRDLVVRVRPYIARVFRLRELRQRSPHETWEKAQPLQSGSQHSPGH